MSRHYGHHVEHCLGGHLGDCAVSGLVDPPKDETDTDHVFRAEIYTETCWYALDGGGRCEHLRESLLHRRPS